jgi:hypothetical protein
VRDRAGLELVGKKAVWAAADHFFELLADRCAGDALRLDEDVREASENNIVRNGCLRMIWKRLSSIALISLVIAAIVWPIGSFCGQRLRRDRVARKHRDVVVEDQPIAKRDRPSQLVRRDLRTLSGLRARGKIVVQREQRVPDHIPVRVGDRRKAPQRVDGCEGDRWDEPQRTRSDLR